MDARDTPTTDAPPPPGAAYGPVTSRQYLLRERAAEDRHEFWDGELVAMGGASPEHNTIVLNLVLALGPALRRRGCTVYAAEMAVALANAFAYPDVVALCAPPRVERRGMDVLANPELVVEVLSAATEGDDRGRKLAAYRALASVREVMLVAQDRPRVEIHRRAGDGWAVAVVEDLRATVALASVGLSVAMAEIYALVLPAEGA